MSNNYDICEDSDDSVKDKDYEPETTVKRRNNAFKIFDIKDSSSSSRQIIKPAYIHNALSTSSQIYHQTTSANKPVSRLENEQEHTDDMLVVTSEMITDVENISMSPILNDKSVTKSGIPRKRRKFDLPLLEREISKAAKKETYDMLAEKNLGFVFVNHFIISSP
uniref:Uncharacterized protein LOC114336742 n=1 Tax=Diabrotica virgifera virgifera TaxID=50390 RepID=A0A6P7G200_DIAVI